MSSQEGVVASRRRRRRSRAAGGAPDQSALSGGSRASPLRARLHSVLESYPLTDTGAFLPMSQGTYDLFKNSSQDEKNIPTWTQRV